MSICDRGRSYDAAELERVAQQKCLAHLIRNAGELTGERTGHARQFGQQLKDILQRALLLNSSRNQMQPGAYGKQVWELDQEPAADLRNRRLRDRDNQETCLDEPAPSMIGGTCCDSCARESSPPTIAPSMNCGRQ